MDSRAPRPFSLVPLALALLASSGRGLAQEQYTIHVSTSTTATAQAHNTPVDGESNPQTSRAAARGTEDSQCVEYGRKSSGAAEASILSRYLGKNSSSVHAAVIADANGGHFRTCLLGCGGNACIGLHGNDTVGHASAAATAVFTIAFDPDARAQPYELTVRNAGAMTGVTTLVEVRDDTGRSVMRNADGGRMSLTGGPGKVYTVLAHVGTALSNKGGCCEARANGDALLGISLQRAPLMESLGMFQPRIVGGHDVLEGQFKPVGALLQDGRPHCTGTLIGEDVVLTAAHCVYERDASRLSFALGNNAWKPESTIPVASYRFPKGEGGFRYDDKKLVDDVAVVKLQQTVGAAGLPLLHAGLPTLFEMKEQNKVLTFVGYGYRLVDNSPAERGIKRFVDIPIDQLEGSTFRNRFPGMNTCNGDSGGPAMFVREQNGHAQWIVAGITSGGDLACVDYGINSRVDRYREWILRP